MSIKANMSKKLAALGLSAAAALSGGYLIVPWEGSVKNKSGLNTVYIDAVGVPTACYGQTGKDLYGRTIRLGMTYTDEECDKMLAETINKFSKDVNRLVMVNYSSPYQEAALVSFAYNVGIGNLQSSTLLRKLNAGQHEAACEELSKWVYAKKKKLKGLVSRREEEKNWCMGIAPYEAEVTYSLIVDMVANTADSGE